MVRHFVGLQSLVYTIHKAYKEIGLILIIFTVTVIMFAALGGQYIHFLAKYFNFEILISLSVFSFERELDTKANWSFYDCIW